MRPIKQLVVHCSATPEGKDFHAADIDRWHREQGWRRIGYHFVIPLDGKVEVGRALNEVGAHAAGFNAHSIGICLIGGTDAVGKAKATFTAAQYDALEKKLRELRVQFPNTEILGHRDLPKVAKECPSFDVRAWCKGRGIQPKP